VAAEKLQSAQLNYNASLLASNIAANEAYVKAHYSTEKFLSTTAALRAASKYTKEMTLPKNVKVAQSRSIVKSNEQKRTLTKELKQAGILSSQGHSVFLIPEVGAHGERLKDAIVNGAPFEFRYITGNAKAIEWQFGAAKKKGFDTNMFITVEQKISINEIRRRIGLVLERHPEYTGQIIVSTSDGNVYSWTTEGFR